jgi:hypothetical protein
MDLININKLWSVNATILSSPPHRHNTFRSYDDLQVEISDVYIPA